MHLRDAGRDRTERIEHVRRERARVVHDDRLSRNDARAREIGRDRSEFFVSEREHEDVGLDARRRNALSCGTQRHLHPRSPKGEKERAADFARRRAEGSAEWPEENYYGWLVNDRLAELQGLL